MSVYSVIACDPPWSFSDGLMSMKRPVKRSAESHYKVMQEPSILDLDVPSLADPKGCVLALWVPGSMLALGLEVVQHWGFVQKQTFVWIKLKKDHALEPDPNKKTRVGMGRLFRQSHEIALICTKGKEVYKMLDDHSQRSVAFDLNSGHSTKPDTLQERLSTMFPDSNRIELFARRQLPGWTCLGNAIDGKDIHEAIRECVAL